MVKINKNNDNELVTRGILKVELKKELKTELEKIHVRFDEQNKRNFEIFATKQDLKNLEYNIKTELKADINKNQTYLEKIVAKLDKKEQENTMHGYQHKTAEDRLANHDKRLEKLEKLSATA